VMVMAAKQAAASASASACAWVLTGGVVGHQARGLVLLLQLQAGVGVAGGGGGQAAGTEMQGQGWAGVRYHRVPLGMVWGCGDGSGRQPGLCRVNSWARSVDVRSMRRQRRWQPTDPKRPATRGSMVESTMIWLVVLPR
jgi:hypothetical protein